MPQKNSARDFKAILGNDFQYLKVKTSLLRNHIPVEALNELELAEKLAGRFIDERLVEPLEAVKEACTIAFTKTVGL